MNQVKLNTLISNYNIPKTWLNVKELSKYLSISESKIRKLICDGEIPYKRVGINGAIRFNVKLVDLWMLSDGTKQTFTKRDRQMLDNLK